MAEFDFNQYFETKTGNTLTKRRSKHVNRVMETLERDRLNRVSTLEREIDRATSNHDFFRSMDDILNPDQAFDKQLATIDGKTSTTELDIPTVNKLKEELVLEKLKYHGSNGTDNLFREAVAGYHKNSLVKEIGLNVGIGLIVSALTFGALTAGGVIDIIVARNSDAAVTQQQLKYHQLTPSRQLVMDAYGQSCKNNFLYLINNQGEVFLESEILGKPVEQGDGFYCQTVERELLYFESGHEFIISDKPIDFKKDSNEPFVSDGTGSNYVMEQSEPIGFFSSKNSNGTN